MSGVDYSISTKKARDLFHFLVNQIDSQNFSL